MTQTTLRNSTLISFVIAFVGFTIVPFTSFYTYGSSSISNEYWWSLCLVFIPIGMLSAAAGVIIEHDFFAAISAGLAVVLLVAGIAGLVGFYSEIRLTELWGTQIVKPYAGFWVTGVGLVVLLCCSLMNTINSWRSATEADDDLVDQPDL